MFKQVGNILKGETIISEASNKHHQGHHPWVVALRTNL